MLAAMQGNTTVFPPVHSPPTDCPSNDLRPLSTPIPVPNYRTVAPQQMIPIAMVPPPLLIGPGGTNYTLVPTTRTDGMFSNLQLSGGSVDSKTIPPRAYYSNTGGQPSLASTTNGDNRFIPLATTVQLDPRTIDPTTSHTHPDQQASPVEIKQPPFVAPSTTAAGSSAVNALLTRRTSSSEPQLSEHHHHGHCERGGESSHRRRRKKHSKRRRHHEKHHQTSDEPDSESSEGCPSKRRHVKNEVEQTPSCSQELPPSTSDPTPRVSYPVQALVDIPMNPPLSSRTSSLSSSLSSFRFGGSLSQLWASQMSLTTRMSNMKSTGNLNVETATMPSLGNQYFAFGGSLPELSLTSLSRLLPNSTSNDANISSCPGLFTLLHPPLYVYPSQQHLTTPFINANGSITFGSFLSGGSSLCNTMKAPSTTTAGGEGSTDVANDAPSTSIITRTENEVIEGGYSKLSGSSTSLSSNGSANIPMFAPVAGPLAGHHQIVTTLPAFHTITNNTMSHSNGMPSPNQPTSAHMTVNSPPHVAAPNLDTLACVATAPHHQLTSPVSPHTLPQHHILHTSTGGAPYNIQPHPHIDSKEGILRTCMPTHFISRPGVIQSSSSLPLPGVKLEREAVSQESPHSIPVISIPISECLASTETHPYSLQEHLPHGSILETSPKREKDKPYKCDHPGCDRSFSFPAHLRSHVQQIHISYRPCKCDFPSCGKRFYTPQHLNVHRRVHTGERPFVCPYPDCTKAFTTAGNLKNHIRTHTGERPYSCKFDGCTKCFAEMSSLKKHELTHTGEKPYKCRVCGKAFSQAGSRNTHERKHNRTDEGDGEAGSKGPRRFRIKRIPSDTAMVKTEPLL